MSILRQRSLSTFRDVSFFGYRPICRPYIAISARSCSCGRPMSVAGQERISVTNIRRMSRNSEFNLPIKHKGISRRKLNSSPTKSANVFT